MHAPSEETPRPEAPNRAPGAAGPVPANMQVLDTGLDPVRPSVLVRPRLRPLAGLVVVAALFFVVCPVAGARAPKHALVLCSLSMFAGFYCVFSALRLLSMRIRFEVDGTRLRITHTYGLPLPMASETDEYEDVRDVLLSYPVRARGSRPLTLDQARAALSRGRRVRIDGLLVRSGMRSHQVRLSLSIADGVWLAEMLQASVHAARAEG